MQTKAKLLLSGLAVVALTAGVSAGLAAADTPSPSPTGAPTASPTAQADPTGSPDRANPDRANRQRAGRVRPALVRRAIHGEVTLGGEQHRVIDFQRGTVEKVSTTSITVKSSDGFTATYVVTADTVVRKDKEKTSLSVVHADDHVVILGIKDGSTVTAKAIRDRG